LSAAGYLLLAGMAIGSLVDRDYGGAVPFLIIFACLAAFPLLSGGNQLWGLADSRTRPLMAILYLVYLAAFAECIAIPGAHIFGIGYLLGLGLSALGTRRQKRSGIGRAFTYGSVIAIFLDAIYHRNIVVAFSVGIFFLVVLGMDDALMPERSESPESEPRQIPADAGVVDLIRAYRAALDHVACLHVIKFTRSDGDLFRWRVPVPRLSTFAAMFAVGHVTRRLAEIERRHLVS
jgi:hypothetical protein